MRGVFPIAIVAWGAIACSRLIGLNEFGPARSDAGVAGAGGHGGESGASSDAAAGFGGKTGGTAGTGGASGFCTDGLRDCSGLIPRRCYAGEWIADDACPYACDRGLCFGECAEGEHECIAGDFKYCDKAHKWQTKECNSCDSSLGCFTECPDVYLGPNNWNGVTPFATLDNPAIVLASTGLAEASPVQVSVELQNRGNRVSVQEATFLELYWSVPTTGFLVTSAGFIGEAHVAVPAAITVPPSPHHGSAITPFYWTPGIGMADLHDGNYTNYTLLARVSHIQALADGCGQQFYDEGDPEHDQRTALRNVHVASQVQSKRLGDDSDGMAFAFAATNDRETRAATVLVARVLD